MPHNLLGRVVIRTLMLDARCLQAVLLSLATLLAAALGDWTFTLVFASFAAFLWGRVTRKEIAVRSEEPPPTS
jgi:hypothetical protein